MNLHEIVSQLIIDTRGETSGWQWFTPDSSLGVFLPELLLCLTIVLMLLVRVFSWGRRVDAGWLSLAGTAAAFCLVALITPRLPARMEIFGGMLVYDSFSIYFRSILLLFAVLFVIFTKLSGVPDREDGPDIYTLVLGSILGMCLMASANHLLMVFMAVEIASVPSYALAGLMKGTRRASEAALKYAVYGAGTAGVMLYGISLLAGLVNTAHLPTMAQRLAAELPQMGGDERMVLVVGGLMLMVGLAFKLSAVPFHFWCPDVFEGATAEVDALLSVASKAAALALLVRVTLGLGVLAPPALPAGGAVAAVERAAESEAAAAAERPVAATYGDPHRDSHAGRAAAAGPSAAGLFAVEDPLRPAAEAPVGDTLAPVRLFMARLVALLAVVTCTFGNLAAYGQTNIKRLLAYSTIAHAGYMMMAVPAVLAMAETRPVLAERAVSALGLYIAVYLFMNLGAFAIVAFLRNSLRSEQMADYAGLIRRNPGVVVCMGIILFGLVGLPPLSGFLGKFAVFASLWHGYRETFETYLVVLLLVGGINTVLSLFYYLRVVKIMALEEAAEPRDAAPLPMASPAGAFVLALTLPTALLIVGWNFLYEWTLAAAQHLLG